MRDVARWLAATRKHHGLPPLESIWVAGVSYGSAIGSAAAGMFDEFAGYVAVSYPASYLWYCTNMQGDAYLEKARARAETGRGRSVETSRGDAVACHVDNSVETSRGDAAACDVDNSVETSRGDAAARDVDIPWRRVAATPRRATRTIPWRRVAATP